MKKRKVPHTFVIVFAIIVIAAVLTWIIPPGKYVEEQVGGETVMTFYYADQLPEAVGGSEFHPEDYFKAFYSSPDIPIAGSYDRLTVSGDVDTQTPGTYEVSYSYTNSSGRFSEVYLTVVVEDREVETEETTEEEVQTQP